MPITNDTILEANRMMLGRTNRAILFATVNVDRSLEPDTPEGSPRPTPSLVALLPQINDMPDAVFLDQVSQSLVVRSFPEFLEKFQPGFYYRVFPGEAGETGEVGEARELAGGGAATGSVATGLPDVPGQDGAAHSLGNLAASPRLEFALEAAPGWKKVRFTTDHPYIRSLSSLIQKRVRQDVSPFRVDIDASLFSFMPENRLLFVRKPGQEGSPESGSLTLTTAGSGAAIPPSDTAGDVARVLPADTLDDMVRALPVVVYGLEQVATQEKLLASSGERPRTVIDALERALTELRGTCRPTPATDPGGAPHEQGPPIAADAFLANRMAAGRIQPLIGNLFAATLQASQDTVVPGPDTRDTMSYHDLFLGLFSNAADDFLRTVTPLLETIMGVFLLFNELPADVRVPDNMRPELIVANADLPDLFVTRPDELKRFFEIACAQAANQFRDAISFVIVPHVAAFRKKRPQKRSSPQFRAADLAAPGRLAVQWRQAQDPVSDYLRLRLSLDARQLLQGYQPSASPSNALVATLVEGLNQVLYDRDLYAEQRFKHVTLSERTRRLLELGPHGQALARLNRLLLEDAYPGEIARRQDPIMLADSLLEQIQAAQEALADEEAGYGRVTFVDEMLDLLDWGHEYGFQVLFSPEERVRAGQVPAEFLHDLHDSYAVDMVVQRETGDCAVLCVPDFILLPPESRLITGRTAQSGIEIGVDMPELLVRSCYVACGRLMANDVPAYLHRRLQKAHHDPSRMRTDLPGVGIDLGQHPFLGETDLPADLFLNDGVLDTLHSPDMPFLVFTGESNRSPCLSVARTMRMLHNADGSQSYRPLHLFRVEVYLNRLLRAAQELGFGGSWPQNDAQAERMLGEFLQFMLKWAKWYDPDRLVNSFPSRLQEGAEFTIHREIGNVFRIGLGFVEGQAGEFRLTL